MIEILVIGDYSKSDWIGINKVLHRCCDEIVTSDFLVQHPNGDFWACGEWIIKEYKLNDDQAKIIKDKQLQMRNEWETHLKSNGVHR